MSNAPSQIAATRCKEATRTPADDFVLHLRRSGRLSTADFETYESYRAEERCALEGLLPGFVTLRATVSWRQLKATHQVFNIIELLQHIFGFLSPTEQLHAQGVCKVKHRSLYTRSTASRLP
jgi:hypothetical protein